MKYFLYVTSFVVLLYLLINVCNSFTKLQKSVLKLDARTESVEKNIGDMKTTVEEVQKSYHEMKEIYINDNK